MKNLPRHRHSQSGYDVMHNSYRVAMKSKFACHSERVDENEEGSYRDLSGP